MEKYSLQIVASAAKELEAIDAKRDRKRIVGAVRALADDPWPHGVEKLSGQKNRFRVRVGDYRVVCGVYDDDRVVDIVKIGHRRDVYR